MVSHFRCPISELRLHGGHCVAFVDLPNAVRAYAGSNGGEFSLCNYVMRVVR